MKLSMHVINDTAMNPAVTDQTTDTAGIKQSIAELILNSSIEVTSLDHDKIQQAVKLLPRKTCVYLPSLPNQKLMSKLGGIATLRNAGFTPVPHIAARRLASRAELQAFLDRAVQDYGVDQVLLVGGDLPQATGPYHEAAMILKDGILADSGIRLVGLPAFPEGHPKVPATVMQAALDEKITLATTQGHDVHLITQFSFDPARVTGFCTELAARYPAIPVHVGMSGPTSPRQLLRYAKLCGVSSSLRAIGNLGFKTTKLISNTDPMIQLQEVARYHAENDNRNAAGVHVFSFGGFIDSAQWMHQTFVDYNS
jgi:methylenetetrahydrofolate reductase (NADPH)